MKSDNISPTCTLLNNTMNPSIHMKAKVTLFALLCGMLTTLVAHAADKPNILVIWGDDIGQTNISAYSLGLMGYRTPNIDRIAREGMIFTDYYAEQSCTAGRSSFLTGQCTLRTGLANVGRAGGPGGRPA